MSFMRWNATPKVIKLASLAALFALAVSAFTPPRYTSLTGLRARPNW